MKRLALVLALVAVVVPGSAPGAGCSPLSCSSTGTVLGNLFVVRPSGVTGNAVVRDRDTGHVRWQLPAGILNGRLLVHQQTSNLTWFDATTGRRVAHADVRGTTTGYLVGASQDGTRAVLTTFFKGLMTFQIVSPQGQRDVSLMGSQWAFDALAGHNLFLLQYLRKGYEVRRYDLARSRLIAQPLKDPHETAVIWGSAWARLSSPDGRYLFTLYVAQNGGAMVHELDVRSSVARCIDLPGSDGFNLGTSYAMQLSPGGKTLWAVSTALGQAVGIDVRSARVRTALRFPHSASLGVSAPNAPVSAISPNGDRIAVALGNRIWVLSTARRALLAIERASASALAFSTDGSRLWIARGTKVHRL